MILIDLIDLKKNKRFNYCVAPIVKYNSNNN